MNLKVASPKESGRIVAHKNVPFSNGNCETKGSKLSEMRNAELYLKRGYSYLRICSKITRTNVRVGKTKLLPGFQLITRWVSVVIVECHFAEMTRDCYTCLNIFAKIRLLIRNRDIPIGVFCRYLTSKV